MADILCSIDLQIFMFYHYINHSYQKLQKNLLHKIWPAHMTKPFTVLKNQLGDHAS